MAVNLRQAQVNTEKVLDPAAWITTTRCLVIYLVYLFTFLFFTCEGRRMSHGMIIVTTPINPVPFIDTSPPSPSSAASGLSRCSTLRGLSACDVQPPFSLMGHTSQCAFPLSTCSVGTYWLAVLRKMS